MIRNHHRRLAAIEAQARSPERRPDLSHLTDHQLELIERCVDRPAGQWDRRVIGALSQPDADALLAAFKSINGKAYAQLREMFGISLSGKAQARLDRLAAASPRTARVQ